MIKEKILYRYRIQSEKLCDISITWLQKYILISFRDRDKNVRNESWKRKSRRAHVYT
jgi:hypothetical protein